MLNLIEIFPLVEMLILGHIYGYDIPEIWARTKITPTYLKLWDDAGKQKPV